MGVLPRRLIKQNLNQVEVFLQDDNNEFIVVQDLPDTFGQGRSSFKVFGSDFLKQGVQLRAEILDSAGTPIFITPVTYRYNGGLPTLPYTYFTIEVYSPPINVGGKAELIILGELDNEKINVPQEFVGRYNVKFRKTINIDVAKTINDSPILFYKKPSVTTTEIVKKRLVPRGSNTTITRIISGSGISGFPLNAGDRYYPDPSKIVRGTVGETPPNTDTTDTQQETSTIKEAPGGDFTELVNLKSFKTGEVRTPKILAKANKFELFSSEEPPTMKIFSTGSLFTSDMVGGEIRIPSQSIIVYNPKQYIGEGNVGIGTGFQTFPAKLDHAAGPELEGAKIFIPDYTASIERVVNDKEIHVKEPFWFQYGVGVDAKYYLADFGNHPYAPINVAGSPRADFFMSFIETTTAETSSFAFDSFLDFNIKNLRTFSGDVYRLRVSGGSKSQISDFPILLDTVLESPQLLIDSNSPSGVLRTGYIQSQAHITKYWESSANLTPSFNSTELIDAVKLSGSLSQKNDVGRFSLKSAYNFEVNKDVVYTLSMRIVGKKGIKIQSDDSITKSAKIKFHVSGSNISPDNNPKYSEPNSFGGTIRDEYGNVVGLELNGESAEKVDYGKISHTFKIPFKKSRVTNLDTIFQVRVESGEWFLSDISLRPALDTGFSPDNVLVRVPIPTNSQRPDKFQFIVQYYDVNNNEAEEVTLVDDVDVEGQSLLIQGDDNLLNGTLSIGNVQGEGVEMVGGNSAFIRAIGYTGFKNARTGSGGGFFMWSGSVTPGGETQDNYNGAGLEIHDGNTGSDESFFKFRTDDADNNNSSSFDIKTSRFFFGQEDSTFVSGALGNIEISSSNLHLTPEGNITASNFQMNSGVIRDTVQILGAVSANSILTPATINGSPATVLNASSSIKSDGLARFVSASIGGFEVSTDTLTGGELILDRNGTIKSADFQEDLAGSGFRLTADNGGFLEVENAKIRGTLKTAVFEKETVNAVGGELYIANSTVLTGSSINPGGIHTPTQNTMSVENASGFAQGEILRLKKVSATGFSTEYVFVNSSSRNDPSSDTDLSGNLFVTRSFGNGISGVSSSVGETAGAAVSYSGSQVIVSTGRYISGDAPNTVGSGYMRLNARPTDAATPFMDIVERTGSGIYDVELKTRLGDLSGVAGTRNIPAGFTGFGLMTETAFLSGSNIKLEAPRFLLGDLNSTFVSGSNSNLQISSSKFHLQESGDVIVNDITASNANVSGKVTAQTGTIGSINILSDSLFSDSNAGTNNIGNITGSGIFLSGSGEFSLSATGSFIRGERDGLTISSPNFSVTKEGVVTATSGSFNGGIEANTGFFGVSNTSGWIIDGTKIRDVSGSIEIDSTPQSPNISLSSGSFTAEIIPEFTGETEILVAGGNKFTAQSLGRNNPSGNVATATANISNGNSSSALSLSGSFSDATTANISTSGISEATLSSGRGYRSTANCTVQVSIDTDHFNDDGADLLGGFTIGGILELVVNNVVLATSNLSATRSNITISGATTVTSNTFSLNHSHTPGGSHGAAFVIRNLTVTNNNLEKQVFSESGGDQLGSFTTETPTNITKVEVFFSSDLKHVTTNKKVEISPKGIQAIFLESDTLEANDNNYFRVAPEDAKPIDFMGNITLTGSIDIKPQSGSGFLNVNSGSIANPSVRFSRAVTTGFASLTSTSIGVVQNNQEKFRFSLADNKFHSRGDIVGFTDVFSDKRLKENVVTISDGLDKVMKLRGVEFDWRGEYKDRGHDLGFIAQEVEEIDGLDTLVSKTWDIRTDKDDYKTVSYQKVIPVLVEAIKQQQQQIDELKKKLEEL